MRRIVRRFGAQVAFSCGSSKTGGSWWNPRRLSLFAALADEKTA